MYSQQDWTEINQMIRKRWLLAIVPAVIVLISAVIIFVYGQLNRSDVLWMVTSFRRMFFACSMRIAGREWNEWTV